MGCFSCFKSSPSVDSSEEEFDRALTFSRHEADIQEAEHIALAMKESSLEEEEEKRRTRAIEEEKMRTRAIEEEERMRARALEEEKRRTRALEEKRMRTKVMEEEKRRTRMLDVERRRTRMMEEDAQIAKGFLYDDRERQINHNSALEDEQIAKAIAKSLKEEGKRKLFEEQLKKDEQIAQDLQNHFNKMSYEETSGLHDNYVLEDKDEQQLPKTVLESLKEKGKRKQFEEQVKKDEQIAAIYQESLNNMVDSPPRLAGIENISTRASWDEDEQLENVLQESLKGKGLTKQSKDEVEDDGNLQMVNPPRSKCGGCNSEIEHGKSVDVLGVLWHPQCLWCDACDKFIAIHQIRNHVSNSRGRYHKACYERYCYICKEKKLKERYHEHHFWKERYCPAHDTDGTRKCCSCERLEPRGTNYVMLGDSRCLCLECMESAVMDTYEVQPLHFEIREYFEGLNMKIEEQFPFLLVEKQALNAAEKEEKIDNNYELVTRGICLSEAQTVTIISKGARTLRNKQLTGMITEPQMVVGESKVTAILILYGLPRLLTGCILAHEMMHAYLRLNGHRIVNEVMEEGICQVLGHMWLESQTYAAIDSTETAGASSSRTPPAAAASEAKKGACSDFEKKLVDFCKNQIEEDDSPVYGLGFKKVSKMVSSSSLPETLKEITRRG